MVSVVLVGRRRPAYRRTRFGLLSERTGGGAGTAVAGAAASTLLNQESSGSSILAAKVLQALFGDAEPVCPDILHIRADLGSIGRVCVNQVSCH